MPRTFRARLDPGWLLPAAAALLLLLAALAGPAARAAAAPEPDPPAADVPAAVQDEVRRLVGEQLAALDTGPLETLLQELNQTYRGYAPELRLSDFIAVYQGDDGRWSPATLVRGLLAFLFREVVANSGLLIKLVVLAVLAALLQNLQNAFAHEGAGRVAQTVVYLVLAGMALGGFGLAVATARQVMADLEGFMMALLPPLLALLLSMGGAASAALLHPVFPVLVSGISTLTATVIFPLIFLAAVLDIASGLHEHLKLNQLAGLLRQGALLVMGLAFTVFLGVTSVKAAAGAVGDSVALRSAKYLAGALLPVVGKMFADAAELVWSSGILLKNALGLMGLVAIFLIAAFPALKILSLVLVYRAAAALIQPVGQGSVVACLNTMAGALTLVFCTVATVALMFFIGITVMIGAANVAVMMR